MKTVRIKHSWFSESDLRLDASFHLSDGVNTKRIIEKHCPYTTTILKDEAEELYKGNIHKRVYVSSPEYGHMFFTASDMFKASIDSGKYISKKYSPYLEELELKKDWILITRSGTLGKVVYITEDYAGKIGTDDLVRIKPSENKIKKGYLYAYLSSKYGYGLLTQSGYGGVVKHIEPHHVENIKIPILAKPKQQEIHNLIVEASNLRVEANRSLNEVHGIFEQNLNFNSRQTLFMKKNVKDLVGNYHSRLDSSYYLNINNADEELSKTSYKSIELGKLVSRKMFTAQRGRRNYVGSSGIRFLSTTNISELNPLLINKYLSRSTQGLDTLIVNKKWILVSSSGQEILGSAFLVDGTYAKCAVNQHSIRVIIDEALISPYYVYGYLSTPKIKNYIRSGIYGSAVLTIDEHFLKSLKVPILNDKIEKISKLVETYSKKVEKACFMEKEAINLIETEIESWQT